MQLCFLELFQLECLSLLSFSIVFCDFEIAQRLGCLCSPDPNVISGTPVRPADRNACNNRYSLQRPAHRTSLSASSWLESLKVDAIHHPLSFLSLLKEPLLKEPLLKEPENQPESLEKQTAAHDEEEHVCQTISLAIVSLISHHDTPNACACPPIPIPTEDRQDR
jgi:hypothetical protein